MFITKMHLPRRTVLRGMGTALALPFLDAMVPALSALSRTAAAPVRRAAWFYVPNGMSMRHWVPKTEGALTDALPMVMESLTPYRDDLLVLSNLADMCAYPREGDPACDHARSGGTYLTGVHAEPNRAGDPTNPTTGVSVDQIAAFEMGRETQLASLQLGVAVPPAGCFSGGNTYPCAYRNTISYRTPTMSLPVEIDPRAVFERLFGVADSTDRASRLARISRNASLLDSVTEEVARLNGQLASTDRTKLSGYLESLREVERQIQMAEEQSDRELPSVDKPAGVPNTFAEHAQLMGDLLVLAYQTDLTRVATFMLAQEVSARAYPEAGVPDSHHALSHHQNVLSNIDRLGKLNAFHMKQFAHVVGKLKSIPEGDGTLLDQTMLIYGTGISDSNAHLHDDLPIALVGGRAVGIKGGRHIRYPKETPVTNLWLTVLDKMGVDVDKLGDSTGSVKLATV